MIDEYFKKYADRINFIELKDYADLDMMEDMKNYPLPIASDVLAEGISSGAMKEEVNVENILDGMISILAIDPEFKYAKVYRSTIEAFHEKIGDYIFFRGIQYLDQGKEERANIYFRALNKIDPSHLLGNFNYGLALERIAQELFNKEMDKKAIEFLAESTLVFEKLLDIDEDYPLAYYKLGYHYRYRQQYLKAKLMWEKYINLDDDELRIQEIRDEILSIDAQVQLETGLTYLSYNRYEEALESFLKILPNNKEWWELRYLIGSTYAGMGEELKAIEEYYKALDYNDQVEDVYNELGIELIKQGSLDEAIKIYNMGIDKIKDSYKLYFNKGLAYYQLGQTEQAYKDVLKAYDLNPTDENVIDMRNFLESSFI